MTDNTLEMTEKPRSQWLDVWDQFRTHKGAVLGLGFLIFITLFCTIGPLIWDVDAGKLNIRNKNIRPIYMALFDSGAKVSWSNPMGSDNLGRDIMANIMQGGRISLAVGWTAMILALLIGTTVPGMLVLMIISISTGDLFATVLAGACTASLLAFLPFNWARARLLLGDTGSEFIGFSLAVISVISFLHRPRVSSIPIFFLIAAIPFTDTAFAIIRRTVHHRSIFAGDREHIHHRLARRIGEKRSVAFLSLLAILSSTVAYVLWNAGM